MLNLVALSDIEVELELRHGWHVFRVFCLRHAVILAVHHRWVVLWRGAIDWVLERAQSDILRWARHLTLHCVSTPIPQAAHIVD